MARRNARTGDGVAALQRPLDRALITLRYEFGHNAVLAHYGERFHGEHWEAVCPLHAMPGERPLTIRERGGHGGELVLDCAGGCLPSILSAELRRLEEWRIVRAAAEART